MMRWVAAACAAGLAVVLALPAFAVHVEVLVATKEGVGQYLTDSEGVALYWHKADAPGKSTCDGPCLEKHPVYYRETVIPPLGVKVQEFGTITRQEGRSQTTFRGYPLHYWWRDKAGDTGGHGVEDWYLIDPANFPPKK